MLSSQFKEHDPFIRNTSKTCLNAYKSQPFLGDHATIIAHWWQIAFVSPFVRYTLRWKANIKNNKLNCYFEILHIDWKRVSYVSICLRTWSHWPPEFQQISSTNESKNRQVFELLKVAMNSSVWAALLENILFAWNKGTNQLRKLIRALLYEVWFPCILASLCGLWLTWACFFETRRLFWVAASGT